MRTFRLLVPALLAGLLAACGSTAPGAVATVNGVAVDRGPIEEAMRELGRDGADDDLPEEQRDERVAARQRNLLTMSIVLEVVRGVAEERGVAIDDDDRQDVVDEVASSVGGEDELDAAIRGAEMTPDFFDEVFVEQQALVWAIRDQITADMAFETRTVRHILVDTAEEADEVVTRLAAGEDFAELATEVSRDAASIATGGELDPAPRGSYVPPFDAAVWDADLEETVGPVESEFGFHVLEVLDEEVVAPEDVTADQRTRLAADEINEAIGIALEEADIEVDAGIGTWDPAQAQVVPADQPVGLAPFISLGVSPGATDPAGSATS